MEPGEYLSIPVTGYAKECMFCKKEIPAGSFVDGKGNKFHFECWIKDMVHKEIDKRLSNLAPPM